MCGDKSVTRISDAYYLMQLISKILFFFFLFFQTYEIVQIEMHVTQNTALHTEPSTGRKDTIFIRYFLSAISG